MVVTIVNSGHQPKNRRNVMKRMSVAVMVTVFAVMSLLASMAIAAQGTIKETADFKIMTPDGWEFSDFGNGTVQTLSLIHI